MNINVRFFVYAVLDDGLDIVECNEMEFLEADGNIQYERDTIFDNGVNQICLTKTNNLTDD